tara:strand:- start:516 stop:1154 length:639 start_codon:yes stop_codon:yes gene_type:complete
MKYVAYYRVSTDKQGRSGLGLAAQRNLVAAYADDIIADYTEVESGKHDDRPQLTAALEHARRIGASILIAKIDRLSRDAAFLLQLRKSGVDIVAADMPHAGTLEFGVRAVVAQHEREEISRRTKAALHAARLRGTRLGSPRPHIGSAIGNAKQSATADAFAGRVKLIVDDLKAAGLTSLLAIASALNERGISTARGGSWHATTVRNVLSRVS